MLLNLKCREIKLLNSSFFLIIKSYNLSFHNNSLRRCYKLVERPDKIKQDLNGNLLCLYSGVTPSMGQLSMKIPIDDRPH